MKLQVNESGAWRDVVSFASHQLRFVQPAVTVLAREIGEPVTWRVVEHDAKRPRSPRVIASCAAPSFVWKAKR